jgi:hypothetical protein
MCGNEFKARQVHIRTGRAKYCSRSCAARSKRGENSGRWNGGRYRSNNGYVYVKSEGHHKQDKYGYVHEAILVLEKKIGRELLPNEVVHHINSIRDDNRPENLAVFLNSEHVKFHGVLAEVNRTKLRTGENNAFYNKHHSEESRARMRTAKLGKKLSPEHREHMRIARARYLERNASLP